MLTLLCHVRTGTWKGKLWQRVRGKQVFSRCRFSCLPDLNRLFTGHDLEAQVKCPAEGTDDLRRPQKDSLTGMGFEADAAAAVLRELNQVTASRELKRREFFAVDVKYGCAVNADLLVHVLVPSVFAGEARHGAGVLASKDRDRACGCRCSSWVGKSNRTGLLGKQRQRQERSEEERKIVHVQHATANGGLRCCAYSA